MLSEERGARQSSSVIAISLSSKALEHHLWSRMQSVVHHKRRPFSRMCVGGAIKRDKRSGELDGKRAGRFYLKPLRLAAMCQGEYCL